MKKSSAKARRQHDDRAFAEFEAVMRKLAKTTRPEVDAERAEADGKEQSRFRLVGRQERA